MYLSSNKNALAITIFILSLSFTSLFAASGDVDSTFVGFASRTNGSSLESLEINEAIKQPDGKVLIVGKFTNIGKYARKGVARLDQDGSVDETFDPPEIDLINSPNSNNPVKATIQSVGLQPDGKVLLWGDIGSVNKQSVGRLIRLNSDGSPDTQFNLRYTQEYNGSPHSSDDVNDIKVQPDGKILLGGNIILYFSDGVSSRTGGVLRLNPDATFDHSFLDTNGSGVNMNINEMKILDSGKIMVGGGSPQNFNYTGLARLNSDGSIDFSFSGANIKRGTFGGYVTDFHMLSNGQVLFAGDFNDVNGFTVGRIGRLNSDGSIDLTFNTNNVGANERILSLDVDGNGKIVIAGEFTHFNGVTKEKVATLNSDGSVYNSFSYSAFNDGIVNEVLVLQNGNIYVVGKGGLWDRSAILNPDGSSANADESTVGYSAIVNTFAFQPDGKILVGGRFETVNKERYSNLVRLNSDGTLDESFVTDFVTSSFVVNKILIQPDGKILVASQHFSLLQRLNPDGSEDTSFSSEIFGNNFETVSDIALLPDGKIIAVGGFRATTSPTNRRIARLNSDGSLDNSFVNSQVNGFYKKVVLQSDGKIIVVGDFTQLFSVIRGRVARLNSDGTLDSSFNPPGGANDSVFDAVIQPDGKIVLVGAFTNLNGSNARQYVGRLNSDGTLDTSFAQTASYVVRTIELVEDGKFLIGGSMASVGGVPRSGFARLNSNGSLDNSFQVGDGTNDDINTIALQDDGKILLGGLFSRYNGQSGISMVRVLNNSVAPNTATKFDFDGDGNADIGVFRPTSNIWYQLLGANYNYSETSFGISGDIVAPGDYDGDGRADLAIFRPSTGDWWYQSSVTNTQVNVQFGQNGDIPRTSDFDGDGKDDFVVYRPSNNNWYRLGSTGIVSVKQFGITNDKPLVGDFDGDGKGDLAIYRPSTGTWWFQSSIDGLDKATQFGISTDIPVPADYDGDGKTDSAVYRAETGVWYISNSATQTSTVVQFGLAGDKPVAADYDGDGKADIAVFRPSDGVWYLLRSSQGFTAIPFGVNTDVPIPNAFVP